MKAVAAAGLPVDRSYIICRDMVDGVEELRAFADEGRAIVRARPARGDAAQARDQALSGGVVGQPVVTLRGAGTVEISVSVRLGARGGIGGRAGGHGIQSPH